MSDQAGLIELAKVSRGAAVQGVITRAIQNPNFFAFGELLDVNTVQDIQSSHPSAVALLQLFAYGTLQEYRGDATKYGTLADPALLKLKQLTLVSLALRSRTLQYDQLKSTLELGTDADVESLIVQSMYNGLVSGKMDQRRRTFHVSHAVGRDVQPVNVSSLVSRLQTWRASIGEAKAALASQAAHISAGLLKEKAFASEYDKRLQGEMVTAASAPHRETRSRPTGASGPSTGPAPGPGSHAAHGHRDGGASMDEDSSDGEHAGHGEGVEDDGMGDMEWAGRAGGPFGGRGRPRQALATGPAGRAAKRRTGPGGIAMAGSATGQPPDGRRM